MKNVAVASAERLLRARQLVQEGAYLIGPDWTYVYANSAGVPGYEIVAGGECPCPDRQKGFARRHGIRCCHEEVARILRQQPPDDPRPPVPSPRCFHCAGPLVPSRDADVCPTCDAGAVATR